jgi:hypothetical protein
MSSIYTKNLEIFNAKQFKESVSEPLNSSIYLTFGKVIAWANDSAPTQANTSMVTHYEIWNNMIGGKLVTGNDMSHAIPRFNWSANTVYNAYDDTMTHSQLYNSNNKFYIVTSGYNVYKCIANSQGNVSTQMPTSITTTSTVTQSDGYVWKYMYSISPSDQIKFTTNSYIPVKTLTENDNSLQWTVQENAKVKVGSIEAIKIINPGANYTSSGITITINGDGTDANAFAQINTASNTISNIVVDNSGRGYSYATVTIASAVGGGAVLKAVISPPGGHGSDPLTELGGSYLIVNPRLKGSEGSTLTINNEYRQLALIEDPILYGTTEVASNTVFSQLTVLTVNGTSVEYEEDETVYQGGTVATATFKGTVVEWDSANNIMKLSNTEGVPDTDILIGDTSSAARFVDSITEPTMEHNSGKVLYIDNIVPIERAETQTEDFKIVLKF